MLDEVRVGVQHAPVLRLVAEGGKESLEDLMGRAADVLDELSSRLSVDDVIRAPVSALAGCLALRLLKRPPPSRLARERMSSPG